MPTIICKRDSKLERILLERRATYQILKLEEQVLAVLDGRIRVDKYIVFGCTVLFLPCDFNLNDKIQRSENTVSNIISDISKIGALILKDIFIHNSPVFSARWNELLAFLDQEMHHMVSVGELAHLLLLGPSLLFLTTGGSRSGATTVIASIRNLGIIIIDSITIAALAHHH